MQLNYFLFTKMASYKILEFGKFFASSSRRPENPDSVVG